MGCADSALLAPTGALRVVVVVVFYYCDMGEDCYNCYILKTGSQLTPRAIVGL